MPSNLSSLKFQFDRKAAYEQFRSSIKNFDIDTDPVLQKPSVESKLIQQVGKKESRFTNGRLSQES